MKAVFREKYPHLFTPMIVGKQKVEFKHRVLVSPMGGGIGIGSDYYGRINDAGVDFHTQFARGGFASITIPVEIPTNGGHNFSVTIDEGVGAFVFMHNVQRSVHAFGAKTFCEIYHAGCCMVPRAGRVVMSASAFEYNGVQVKQMNEQDMQDIIKLYVDAALTAKRAGFDGVCLHYGHGWLMSNYLSPLTNHRTDEYGGSVENRVRFPRRVMAGVREAVGDSMLIELRMNGSDAMEGGVTPEDAAQQALLLQNLADMVHVSCGIRLDASCRPKMHPTCFVPDAHNAVGSEALKKAGVKIPVGVVGSIHDPELAERLLAEGKADYILMARQAAADPDWVRKVKEDRVEDIRPCIRCDYCVDGGKRGALTTAVTMRNDASYDCHCSVNPLFRQGMQKLRALRPSKPKQVIVVGGGIAGMQAAITAAGRGHRVTLLEKSGTLGGQTFFADHMWFKKRIKAFRQYLITQIGKAGVSVLFNVEATPGMIAEADPDVAIIAVGGEQIIPLIPGVDAPHVVPAWNVFGHEQSLGQNILLVGGGSVGCETAIHLAGFDRKVTVLEMGEYLAATAELSERSSILENMEKYGVSGLTNARCMALRTDGAEVLQGGVSTFFAADSVVLCAGTRSLSKVRDSFRDVAFDVISVGDCVKPGTIRTAVESGWDAGATI